MKKSELKEQIKNVLKESNISNPILRAINLKLKTNPELNQTINTFLQNKNVKTINDLNYDDLLNLRSIIYKNNKKNNPIDNTGKEEWLQNQRQKGKTSGLDESNINEDDWQQPDDESSMAEIQLRSIISNASKLLNIIENNDQLDSWIQSKLAIAQDNLQSVSDYLSYEE